MALAITVSACAGGDRQNHQTFYYSQLSRIHAFLCATASGRQGVPDPSMTMHLWRYLRRGLCWTMYERGFYTDRLPETGLITVFFENDVDYINHYLGQPE